MGVEYVAGLFDGDGSFSVNLSRHPTIPCGYQVQPVVLLQLSTRDAAIFEYVMSLFPGLRFKELSRAKDMVMLRLRSWDDVLVFVRVVRPHLRIFTNVRRAALLERIAEIVVEDWWRAPSGCREHFPEILRLVAEMRRYAKRSRHAAQHSLAEIAKQLGLDPAEVLPRSDLSLEEEGLRYEPRDFGWEYLAGLFDAEGYIGLVLHRHPRHKFGYQVAPIVNLNLAIYDSKILYKLVEKLAHLNPQVKTRRQNNTAYFQIWGVYATEEFIRLVKPYSRLPTMRRRLELVERAIELIHEGAHSNEAKWRQLMSIVEELRLLSKRRRAENTP